MTANKAVVLDVHVDLAGETVRAGTAYVSERRRHTSTSFTYDPGFLARPDAYDISPDMPLASARHQVDGLPGTFADTAPDRWGRNLIDKKLRRRARDGGALPSVREVDYLVGVSDLTRQGALRYTEPGGTVFLAPDPDVPRIVELPRLLRAADAVAAGDEDYAEVELLLDAGTGSAGGGGSGMRVLSHSWKDAMVRRTTTSRSRRRLRRTAPPSAPTSRSCGFACSSRWR